ncbi:MAG: hypothetical protein H8D23_26735, partial [Candidatus Brocadiales bacterium]|nr:hypothetical protein [Candidatus Brocadiales bacterium]
MSQVRHYISDTLPPIIRVVTSNLAFSPNSDGVNDNLLLSIQCEDIENLVSKVNYEIRASNNALVYAGTFQADDDISYHVTWSGKNQTGQYVPQGQYTCTIFAADMAGNVATKSV